VQRQFHFQLDNSNGFGLYAGMLGAPKPALTTYRNVLAKEFGNARFVGQKHGSAGVGMLEGNSPFRPSWKTIYDLFEFRDGKRRLWIAFTDTTQPVTIQVRASRPFASLVDRHNVRTKVYAKNGVYEVPLTGATHVAGWPTSNDPKAKAMGQPEHLVGGATIVIVEEP
jgi:hypothetical protein